jgi:hypothetical protein
MRQFEDDPCVEALVHTSGIRVEKRRSGLIVIVAPLGRRSGGPRKPSVLVPRLNELLRNRRPDLAWRFLQSGWLEADESEMAAFREFEAVLAELRVASTSPPVSRLDRLPGYRLMRVLEFLCSARVVERVLRPAYGDACEDYMNAVAEGSTTKAWWIGLRSRVELLRLAGMMVFVRLSLQAWEIWSALRARP